MFNLFHFRNNPIFIGPWQSEGLNLLGGLYSTLLNRVDPSGWTARYGTIEQ